MATIKIDESTFTSERDLTLDIHWEESHYPDDDSSYMCRITFPVPHIQSESVKVDYSDQYRSDVLARMTRDISDYLEDPQAWTEEMIKKGVGPVLELRQLEKDLAEARKDHERYTRYASQEAESIKKVEQEIAAHKAKHGL